MGTMTDLTEKLWKEYFSSDDERVYHLLDLFLDSCCVIGTGKHEIYKNLGDFRKAVSEEFQERKDIKFQFKNLKCEEIQVSDEISLVYGSIDIEGRNSDGTVKINMDSRFSILYKRENGVWKVCHIHHSTPNNEQMFGESYPKTLVNQIESANEMIKSLTKLAEVDSLTGLINTRTLKEKYTAFPKKDTWLFVLDIDNFKDINDKFGHLKGDHVLIRLAEILSGAIRESDLVCRMGGDEFILLCTDIKSEHDAGKLTERLMKKISDQSGTDIPVFGVSIGFTHVEGGESLENAFKRADRALYKSKRSGKGKVSME